MIIKQEKTFRVGSVVQCIGSGIPHDQPQLEFQPQWLENTTAVCVRSLSPTRQKDGEGVTA